MTAPVQRDSGTCRVLHVVEHLGLGGIQSLVFNLFAGMPAADLRMDLAVLHGPGRMDAAFSELGCRPLYAARTKYSPLLPMRLCRIIGRNRYDIVHAHGVIPCFVCERLSPLFAVRRQISHLHHIFRGWRGLSLARPVYPFAYRKAGVLLACSDAALKSLPSVPGRDARVLYAGVDTARFHPAPAEERAAARHELGFREDDFVVGTAGRLAAGKDIAVLLRAAAALGEARLRILVVGAGPDERRLKALADELGLAGRAVWAGYQPRVEAFLRAMDVFALPSRSEGLGVSVIEAMASGLPCIVSDYESAAEVVADGVNGLVFQRGDAAMLANRIQRFAADAALRQRCGAAARRRAVEAFSLDRMVRELGDLYRGLALCNAGTTGG